MKPVRLRDLSRVVRTINLRLPSNRLMALASIGGFLGVFAWQLAGGAAHVTAGRAGLQIALCIFLSWAVARELDPDSTRSAGLALVFGAGVSLSGEPNLWAVTAVLFAGRIALRSTGASPNVLDLIWLSAVGAAAGRAPGGWIAGVALAGALVVDWRLPPRSRLSLAGAVLTCGATVLAALGNDSLAAAFTTPDVWEWAVFAAVLLSLAGFGTEELEAVGDIDGRPLAKDRLVYARALTLGAGFLTAGWIGGKAIPGLVGLWAAVLGTDVNGVVSGWRQRRDPGGGGFSQKRSLF